MITYTGKDEILNSLRVIPPCSMVVETSCGNSRKVLGRYWEVYKRILKGEKVSKWEIFWNILTSFFKPMPGPELRGHACIYWGGGKNEVVEAALGKVSWFLFSLPHGIIQRSDFKGKIHPDNGIDVYFNSKLTLEGMMLAKAWCYGSCLSGDTKIPLLDGTTKTIKELSELNSLEKIWTYSLDEQNNIVPGKVLKAWKTGTRQTLKLTFDNNKFFECTPDHEIMLRNGIYKKAKDLKVGDSLMPLYKHVSAKGLIGYELVYCPGTKSFHFTHRIISKHFYGKPIPKAYIVHHKNYVKENNIPENLNIMFRNDHTKLHAHDDGRYHEHLRKLHKWMRENGIYKEIGIKNGNKMRGRKIHWITKTCETCGKIFEGAYWYMKDKKYCCLRCAYDSPDRLRNISEFIKKRWNEGVYDNIHTSKLREIRKCACGCDEEFECIITSKKRYIQGHGMRTYSWRKTKTLEEIKKIEEKLIKGKTWEEYYGIEKAREMKKRESLFQRGTYEEKYGVEKARKLRELRRETMKRIWKENRDLGIAAIIAQKTSELKNFNKDVTAVNHKVTKIESYEIIDVYDLSIEKYHNFALDCGIFVHNCGRTYDLAAFFGFLDTNINNIHDIEGADVCSEHAVRVIREADLPIVPEVKEPSQVHPTHIYEYCESKQGKRDGWKKVWSWDGINAFTY